MTGMAVVVSHLLNLRHDASVELQRFWLLWRYQHTVPAVTLGWRLVLKRAIDSIGAAVGLMVFAPVMTLIAVAVKVTSRGPMFYSQERVGRFGDLFHIYKFRTMRVDAEANGPVWSSGTEDARLTPIGGFLRRSHLDELPQLFNVLRGEMSLVGPRPERPHFVESLNEAIPRYDERLYIRPGVTGLAQVYLPADQNIEDVKRKLRFDLLYVKRMCLLLDARIIAWTFLLLVTGRNIH